MDDLIREYRDEIRLLQGRVGELDRQIAARPRTAAVAGLIKRRAGLRVMIFDMELAIEEMHREEVGPCRN